MRTVALVRAEDFARVADVLGPCELVRGEIVRATPAGVRHSQVTMRAAFLLELHNRSHRLGHVLTGETGLIVSRNPDTVRGADVAFISYSRLPKDAQVVGFLERAPELIVEVLSDDKSWQSMEEKIADYHRSGVNLVWVLDPRTVSLHAYAFAGSPVLLRDADTVSADPHVPGFSCRVAELFEH